MSSTPGSGQHPAGIGRFHAHRRPVGGRPAVRLRQLAQAQGAPGTGGALHPLPHQQAVGGPLTDESDVIDEFLRLASLTYGDDDPARLRHAQSLLEQHDWLAQANIHTIAGTGEVDAARALLDREPAQASLVGGPHQWEPLLYLAYSRAPLAPGNSAVGVARLLL